MLQRLLLVVCRTQTDICPKFPLLRVVDWGIPKRQVGMHPAGIFPWPARFKMGHAACFKMGQPVLKWGSLFHADTPCHNGLHGMFTWSLHACV